MTELADDFDAVTDPDNFLSIRGGSPGEYCDSMGNALVMTSTSTTNHEIMTRDIKLIADEIVAISAPLPSTASAPWNSTVSVGFTYGTVRLGGEGIWCKACAHRRHSIFFQLLVPKGCGFSTNGWLFKSNTGPRVAQTLPLDLRSNNLTLSFTYAVGPACGDAIETGARDERMHVDYSIDGGETWVTLASYDNGGGSPAIAIPVAAQTRRTVLRFVQHDYSEDPITVSDTWGIADVSVCLGKGTGWSRLTVHK